MLFAYKAYDQAGSLVENEIEEHTLEQAKIKIEKLGYFLLSIAPKEISRKPSIFNTKKLTLSELEFITSEMSLLLRSGVKVDRCLDILSKSKSSNSTEALFTDMAKDVKKGESLSQAFSKFPDFDALYINLIKMGEESGQLAEIFNGLANDLKYRKQLRGRIIQSITYPSVIFFVCVVAILFVFNFIVPQMSSLFDENDNLPYYTEILLNLSAWMQAYQLYFFFFIMAFIALFLFMIRKDPVKEWMDLNLIKLPVICQFIYKVERIRFNTSMALMLDSGVKIDRAIALSAQSVKNSMIRNQLLLSKNKVKNGMSLTEAFKGNPIYPDFLLSLVEVGEETSKLSEVFDDIASRSRGEFEDWTAKITSLLEPLMILFMGGIVGTVVVVMLLSIISVNDSF